MLAYPFDKPQAVAVEFICERGLPESVCLRIDQCAKRIRSGHKCAAMDAKGPMKFGESGISDGYTQRRRGIAQDAIMRFLISPERVRVDGRIELHIDLLATARNPAGRVILAYLPD